MVAILEMHHRTTTTMQEEEEEGGVITDLRLTGDPIAAATMIGIGNGVDTEGRKGGFGFECV
jgi:hypothetical protein